MKRLLILLLMLTSAVAWGQAIKGTVTDAKTKETIPGANVTVPGLRGVGVTTDFDGNFTVDAQGRTQIQVSFVGYKTKTVNVQPGANVAVSLDPDSQMLDEYVIVGFGSQKKENLTGAITTVDVGKSIDSRPVTDAARALQGSTPGLTININTGEVGSEATMRIRGQIGSINGTSTPLILVDNVEVPSLLYINPDDIEAITILKDAASTSIYGAKAAFGVILITSKKGTDKDRISVTYTGQLSWNTPTKNVEMATVDGMEYAVHAMDRVGQTYKAALNWRTSRQSWEAAKAWQEKYGKYGEKAGLDADGDLNMKYGRDYYMSGGYPYGVRSWDAKNMMISKWAPTHQHQFSINGTTGRTSYNLGLSFSDQRGAQKQAKKGNDHFARYTATLNVTSRITDWFTLKTKFMYANSTVYTPMSTDSNNSAWLYLYRWGPAFPIGKQDDVWLRGPVGETAGANAQIIANNYMNFMTGFTVTPLKGWSIDVDYTFSLRQFQDLKNGTVRDYYDSWSLPVLRKDETGAQLYVNSEGERVSASTAGAMEEYTLRKNGYMIGSGTNDIIASRIGLVDKHAMNAYTTYDFTLADKHNFKVMLGSQLTADESKFFYQEKKNLIFPDNPQFNFATAQTAIPAGQSRWESTAGFFGRLNYNFSEKYLFEANLRYDGSSKFPTYMKWALFPSFSAGYRISEEKFWEPLRNVWSSMMLRASWGSIGNQAVPNTLYIPSMALTSGGAWIVNGVRAPSYGTPAAIREDIGWERVETLNLGVDARFFNNKLGLVAEWFQRDTKDMIIVGPEVSSTYGATSPVGNYGTLRTTGYEIALDFNHRFSNGLNMSLTGTFSDAVAKITKYVDATTHPFSNALDQYYTGKTYGEIWGYVTDRLYQKEDFVYDGENIKQKVVNSKTVNVLKEEVYQDYLQSGQFYFGPGDVKYKDLNGDKKIDDGGVTIEDPGDKKIIGNRLPRYEYSFRVNLDWKGVDFSVYLQGVGSRQEIPDGSLVVPGYNISDGAMSQAIAGDFWREDRTDAFYPRAWDYGAVAGTPVDSYNNKTQTKYLLDMSYLRVKNVILGYSLPSDIISKIKLSKVRFFVSAENLLTFDKLGNLPIDPEVRPNISVYRSAESTGGAGNAYNAGRIGVGTPIYQTYAVGIQLAI